MNRSNLSIIAAATIVAGAILAAPHWAPSPRLPRTQPLVPQIEPQKAFYSSEAEYVFVAQTLGIDDALDNRIRTLLLRHGIRAKIGGEFIYGVSVPLPHKEQAIALLAIDADRNGYWINFDTAFPRTS